MRKSFNDHSKLRKVTIEDVRQKKAGMIKLRLKELMDSQVTINMLSRGVQKEVETLLELQREKVKSSRDN